MPSHSMFVCMYALILIMMMTAKKSETFEREENECYHVYVVRVSSSSTKKRP